MNTYIVVGIDLAKHKFEVCGIDQHGKMSLKKSINRGHVTTYFANLPKTTIAVEACAGAHYWTRCLRDLGHDAKIIPAQFVRPFVKANKNDRADAGAIAEAAMRPGIDSYLSKVKIISICKLSIVCVSAWSTIEQHCAIRFVPFLLKVLSRPVWEYLHSLKFLAHS